jgi:aspartate/methionine/tyrosine aminotransferase
VRIPLDYTSETPTFDLDAVEALLPESPVLFMYSHPNNPTGAVFAPEVIQRLAELSLRGGFRVLADELYSRLVYDGAAFAHMLSIPGMEDRCITMLGPSKTESLSGYRLGVVVGPPDVMEAVEQTLAATSLRAPAYAQHLLTRWLVEDTDFVAERILELKALREMTLTALRTVPGLTMTAQGGTAYLFVNTSALGASDQEIAGALQREAGVIVSPGYQFGPAGVGNFRVCYARDETEWELALAKMVTCLTGLATAAGITV